MPSLSPITALPVDTKNPAACHQGPLADRHIAMPACREAVMPHSRFPGTTAPRPTRDNGMLPRHRPDPCACQSLIPPPISATGPKRSEEHTSELQSLMRISYAVFCLKKKKKNK